MLEKVKAIALRCEDLEAQLADPAVYGDAEKLRTVTRELKELTPVAEAWRAWCRAKSDRDGAEEMLADPDLREMAKEEFAAAQEELGRLDDRSRTVILLKFYEDMTFREIAQVLRKPESTVKSDYYRGMNQLKERTTQI